jgi:SAM-dependent methyltransferase
MVLFKNAQESHAHSLETLNLFYMYDSFLDSLEFIADFGCGSGLDLEWWATLETRDDPPEPRNYKCIGVDTNLKGIAQNKNIPNIPNIRILEADFDQGEQPVPRTIDFIWSHDSFQYVTNPLHTLKIWNQQLNINGMMVLIFPQPVHYSYNRLQNASWSGCYHNYNIVNLMYMLAVNGFDCRDAYFLKKTNDPWLHVAVYKSDIAPMDPKTTTWYDLAGMNLLNDSVISCINRFGFVKQEEIITTWLDKDFHYPKE